MLPETAMLTIKNLAGTVPVSFFVLLAAVLAGCTPEGPHDLRRGRELIDDGRYPEAVEILKEAASLLPTNSQAWNYLGLACQHAGQITNAVQAYQRALALDYDLAEVHFNLGCLWLD